MLEIASVAARRMPAGIWLVPAWLLAAAITTGQVIAWRSAHGMEPMSVGLLYAYQALGWVPWALIVPLVVVLVRRHPVSFEHPSAMWRVHLPVGLAAVAAKLLYDNLLAFLTEGVPLDATRFLDNLVAIAAMSLHAELLSFAAILAVAIALDTFRRLRRRDAEAERLERRATALEARQASTHNGVERLTVPGPGGRTRVVQCEAIDWIEAADYCVQIHAGPASHLLRESLRRLEQRLDPRRFVRVHRSAIVNVDRVERIERRAGGGGEVVLHDATRLRLSRSGRRALERVLA